MRATLEGGIRYRGREGQLSYLLHRISGVGTLLFLAIHILDTSTVYFFPALYEHAINLYRATIFMIGEILLVAAVIFHGTNGLRIVFFDLYPSLWHERPHRKAIYITLGISFVLWLPAAYFISRSLYIHNICQCPSENEVGFELPHWVNFAIIASISIGLVLVLLSGFLRFSRAEEGRNFDTLMWVFMRWSGILLLPLVWIHVLLNDVLIGVHRIDLDYVALRWAVLCWRVYDIALLAFAFVHGMNGFRNVMRDYVYKTTLRKWIDRILFSTWVVLTTIGGITIIGGWEFHKAYEIAAIWPGVNRGWIFISNKQNRSS